MWLIYRKLSLFIVNKEIWLYESHFVYLLISWWYLGCFHFGLLWVILLWTFVYKLLFEHLFFNSWGHITRCPQFSFVSFNFYWRIVDLCCINFYQYDHDPTRNHCHKKWWRNQALSCRAKKMIERRPRTKKNKIEEIRNRTKSRSKLGRYLS